MSGDGAGNTPLGETAASGPDARFEDADAGEKALRLKAETADDLAVISSLMQDAVGTLGDIVWMRKKRRLVVMANRFRWEDAEAAAAEGRPYERVRAALTLEDVLSVKGRGIAPGDREVVVSLLSVAFEPGEDGAGRVILTLAGDAEIAAEVECLDASLADLTRPWIAQAKAPPAHEP